MARKLHYFNFNGLAEPIRYMLHYAGHKFEDVQYEFKKWPIQSIKDSLPYGQFPLYEENGKSLNQSLAIARYVASQSNLLPADAWDQAELDAIVFNIYDFWSKVLAYIKESDPAKKEAIKKELLEETVNFYFSRFEKELKKNNGHFSKKLSWADFILLGIIEASNLFLGSEIHTKYPTIVNLVNKLRALPGVKDYIAKRAPYNL
ncbi:glutathione S-transferase-like [Zerene cesonia]|uniref:glutathione S-transferase-like n=1 Tax=Zerene cesonia TaxID=33412 RepID=UPI0018E50CB3|nr:glutathione S-transferase-like [Zerene cesonia]